MNAIKIGEIQYFNNQQEAIDKFLKDDFTPLNKGEFIDLYLIDIARTKLYICCPKCGVSSFTGPHTIINNKGIYTVSPSIIMQCCGWHGYLKNNKFE